MSWNSISRFSRRTASSFFVDLYNLLTIHGVTKLSDFPKSVLDLNQFAKTTSYRIGPHVYSLDDIEHGILRGERVRRSSLSSDEHIPLPGNKPHSNCTQRHFTFNDPRAKYAMRRCDPRIHFALNCAARSSPSIVIYSSTNLEKTLNMVTSSHCNMEIDVELDNARVHLSKLFHWYRSDFGRSDLEVLRSVRWNSPLQISVTFNDASAVDLDGSPSISMSRNDRRWGHWSISRMPTITFVSRTKPTIGCWTMTRQRTRAQRMSIVTHRKSSRNGDRLFCLPLE